MEEARSRLAGLLDPTPLVRAGSLGRDLDARIELKLETVLPTRSFKVRGALFALGRRLERGDVAGVVAASTGNHGAAVAYAGRTLGVPATIFVPVDPNPVKRDRIRGLGAEVVEAGRDITEARRAAGERAEDGSVYLLDDATDPELPAGPATIATEVLEAAPEVRSFVVPVGDTALIRGVAAAAKARRPEITVAGVQAAGAPAYTRSWEEGRVVPTETCDTVADGLATRTPVEDNVEAIRGLVDEMVLVSEGRLLEGVRRLLLEEGVLAEPAGAAPVAALPDLTHLPDPVCLVVTGANVPASVLARALEQAP